MYIQKAGPKHPTRVKGERVPYRLTGGTRRACGVQVKDVADPLMRMIRYVDMLVDELARRRNRQKMLRS